jgi:putative tryptophan/tyrosine transport system substrate-binding protein
MIGRRRMIIGMASALASARMAHAQTSRPRKIGYLHPRTADRNSPTLQILRPFWEQLGYVEDETILFRSANSDLRHLPRLARELVAEGAGVLIAVGPAAVRAASQLSVPVVAIDLETDPVRSGFAASIARPGGNVTGLFLDQPSLAGKWIELLRLAVPGLERIGLVWDPFSSPTQLEAVVVAARGQGLDVLIVEIHAGDDYARAFERLVSDKKTAVAQLGSPGFIVDAPAFAAAAQKHKLPTMSFLRNYAHAGALMTFGTNQGEFFHRAVIIADKILKGENAADIPIEGPRTYELVVNLKTAKAIGLDIPPTLLVQADEVIE